MNHENIENKQEIDLEKFVFGKLFEIDNLNNELDIKNIVDQEKYPTLFILVQKHIENFHYLKNTYQEVKSNNMQEELDSIYKILFQDNFFLAFILENFKEYGQYMNNLETLEEKANKKTYVNILSYGVLTHCYEDTDINWELVREINNDMESKILLEKEFNIKYGLEEKVDFQNIFQEELTEIKSFFEKNSQDGVNLSDKINSIDSNNSGYYIRQKTKYELMYALGNELRQEFSTLMNQSGLTDMIISTNKRFFNLNTNQIIQQLQEKARLLLERANVSDKITEKEEYNRELMEVDKIISELNFSNEQVELIKIKFIPYIQDYIKTLRFLEENEFQLNHELVEILDQLIKQGKDIDKILKEEGIGELSEKLGLLPLFKLEIEKDIILKNIFENIGKEKYILSEILINQYINHFGEDKNILLIKEHMNNGSIIEIQIEQAFILANGAKNNDKIINLLKDKITEYANNRIDNNQLLTKMKDIYEVFEKPIRIGSNKIGEVETINHLKDEYIKNKIQKWLKKIEKIMLNSIKGNSEAIKQLKQLQENNYFEEDFTEMIKISESSEKLGEIEKLIYLGELSLEKNNPIYLKNSIHKYIESIKYDTEKIKEILQYLSKNGISSEKNMNLMNYFMNNGKVEKISQTMTTFMELLLQEAEKENSNEKFIILYSKLAFGEIEFDQILEEKELLLSIFENKSLGETVYRIYLKLKQYLNHNVMNMIMKYYIKNQDEKAVENQLKQLVLG